MKYLYCFVILRWQNWRKRKNVADREKTQDGEAGGGGGGRIKGTTTNSKLYTYTKRQRQNKLKKCIHSLLNSFCYMIVLHIIHMHKLADSLT